MVFEMRGKKVVTVCRNFKKTKRFFARIKLRGFVIEWK